MDQPRRHLQSTSSSSAVDLTGTPAGLAASLPPSPSLSPSDGPESVTRRRPSWTAPRNPFPLPTVQISTRTFSVDDDPFASPAVSPVDDTPPRSRAGGTYLTTRAGPSSASLIQTLPEDEDDEAYLTASISHQHPPGWSVHETNDPERPISASPRSRRRSNRYSTSLSPLKKTGTTLQSVSRSLRHMSIRVVNLAGRGLDDHIRLDDMDEDMSPKRRGDDSPEEPEYPALPDLRKSLPIRGRALGFMGPTNPVRLFMYRFLLLPYVVCYQQRDDDRLLTLVSRWTEPIVLLLISFHLVVLSIQSARSLTLAAPDAEHPRVRGYFHQWEDYALFALFVFFTYANLHSFSASPSHLLMQDRMFRTYMCLRFNPRPRGPLLLYLYLPVQAFRGRTYPHCRDSRSCLHSVDESVWYHSDTNSWSSVASDEKQLLQAVRIESQTDSGYNERWRHGSHPYPVGNGDEDPNDGKDDGHDPADS